MNVHADRARSAGVVELPRMRVCALAVVLLIGGCAGSMGTMHADPTIAPATSFDGTYQSSISLTSTSDEAKSAGWCQTSGQPSIAIANGEFSYALPHPNVPGNPTPVFQATMAPDGSFSGQNNDGSISGMVRGTHLEGTISGTACVYAISGDRT
jgi:hypothetical protein